MFDVNGDGVGPLEETMMKYDLDGTGCFSPAEVKQIVHDMEEEKKVTSMMGKLIGALVLVIVALCGIMFAAVILGNEASKENHVDGDAMVNLEGDAVRVDTVESHASMWDLPLIDMADLAYMRHMEFYVVKNGEMAPAAYKVSGAYKDPTDGAKHVYIVTPCSRELYINADVMQANLTILASGDSFLVSFGDDDDVRRRRALREEVETSAVGEVRPTMAPTTPPDVFVSPKEFKVKRAEQTNELRRLGFFSALMTSGNFMMMQAGAFR
jgi:hypothetical protein